MNESASNLSAAADAMPGQPLLDRQRFLEEIKQELTDPITLALPTEPVIAADGQVYDRRSISQWFSSMGIRAVSPKTGKVMPHHELIVCFQLNNIVALLREMWPELEKASQTDADLELAVKLHMEELQRRLAEEESKRGSANQSYRQICDELGSTVRSSQAQINYFVQRLAAAEQSLARLRDEMAQAATLASRIQQEPGALSSVLSILSQHGPQLLSVDSGVSRERELDVSSGWGALSLPALVDSLREEPGLVGVRSATYGQDKSWVGHPAWVDKILPLPDGSFLTASQHSEIIQWSGLDFSCLRRFRGHQVSQRDFLGRLGRNSQVYDLALSPSGRYFASACADQTVKIWSLETGACVQTVENAHEQDICCVCFIGERCIASGSRDKTVVVTNLDSGQVVTTLSGHSVDVYGVVYLEHKNCLVSCAGSEGVGEIKVWDLSNNQCTRNLAGHQNLIYEMIRTQNGHYVITGCDDHTIRVWDTSTWECTLLAGHQHFVNTLCMANDHILVSGGEDEVIKLWDIATGECLQTLPAEGKIWGIASLPDQTIVCGDTRGKMYAYQKLRFDLGFRFYLRSNCSISQTSEHAQIVTISLNQNGREGETPFGYASRLRGLCNFMKTQFRDSITIRHEGYTINCECRSSQVRSSVFELLTAFQYKSPEVQGRVPASSGAQSIEPGDDEQVVQSTNLIRN